MKDLWERLKRHITGQDTIDQLRREHEQRMEWRREDIERARKQARAELRDRFAIEALPVCLERKDQYGPQSIPDAAQHAYAVADAMLKARGDD